MMIPGSQINWVIPTIVEMKDMSYTRVRVREGRNPVKLEEGVWRLRCDSDLLLMAWGGGVVLSIVKLHEWQIIRSFPMISYK
jgi:hypothetical protein